MPKLTPRTAGMLATALVAAVVAAIVLSEITHQGLGLSSETVRGGALNGASLVVAFLLVAGIRRRPNKDKR